MNTGSDDSTETKSMVAYWLERHDGDAAAACREWAEAEVISAVRRERWTLEEKFDFVHENARRYGWAPETLSALSLPWLERCLRKNG